LPPLHVDTDQHVKPWMMNVYPEPDTISSAEDIPDRAYSKPMAPGEVIRAW
jgi:hypothetical protein